MPGPCLAQPRPRVASAICVEPTRRPEVHVREPGASRGVWPARPLPPLSCALGSVPDTAPQHPVLCVPLGLPSSRCCDLSARALLRVSLSLCSVLAGSGARDPGAGCAWSALYQGR